MNNMEFSVPELLGDMKRTDYCGDLGKSDVNRDTVIMGGCSEEGTWEGSSSWNCGTGKESSR